MKKCKKIVIILILIFILIYLLINHTVECIIVHEQLKDIFGDWKEVEVEYSFRENKLDIDIGVFVPNSEALNKVYEYWLTKLDNSYFIVNRLKCDYNIDIKYINSNLGYHEHLQLSNNRIFETLPETVAQWSNDINYAKIIFNVIDFGNEFYYPKITNLIFGYPEVKDFDFSVLKCFPNLKYIYLCNGKLSKTEFEYIQNILPKDCVIEGYKIIEE